MADPALVLRDVHQPPAPSWWPPAAGWWLAAGALLVVALALWWWRARRERRRKRIAALFDDAVAQADGASARVAAMSELLRRVARTRDPHADRLEGDAWLALLDGNDPAQPFSKGAGRLLLDGGFRPDVDADALAALHRLARQRFLAWMPRR